jgi:uncharacterized membrane protein
MEPENPYDAPHAALQTAESDEPRRVPPGAPIMWYGNAWTAVMADAGTWIGMFLLLMVAVLVLSCVPLATNLLMPVLTAGVALACDAQRRGEPLSVEYLLAGFRSPQVMQLVLIGVLTLAASMVLMMVMLPVMFGGMALFGNAHDPHDPTAGIVAMSVMIVLVALVAIPLAMATVFAPMLVVFHNLSAFEAMKLSLRGCLLNLGALVVWFCVGIAVAIVASLPFFLGWIIAAPVTMVVNYVAYRDIYVDP